MASYLGVNPANDEWLRVFMELVLMIQDPAWKVRSFFVPGFVKDEVAAQPSSISADVNIVKRMMMYDIKAEKPVPLPKEGVEKLRWHGCKATMPTFMSHFNIRGKVIRYQGAWAKKADTMPDTYLREAQVIVLKGQIETLERIRAGESISALVGVGLNPGAPGAAPTDGASQTGEMPSGSPEELKRADAMAPAACKPTLAKDESGKVHFVEGELPDSSNFPDQLIDERLRDLTEKKVSSRELFAMLADENAEAAGGGNGGTECGWWHPPFGRFRGIRGGARYGDVEVPGQHPKGQVPQAGGQLSDGCPLSTGTDVQNFQHKGLQLGGARGGTTGRCIFLCQVLWEAGEVPEFVHFQVDPERSGLPLQPKVLLELLWRRFGSRP